jgi:uncharacterized protein (TIGR02757 family)
MIPNESLHPNELKQFLNEKAEQYEVPGFIENDPISIPHQFDTKEDIEIAAFLAATIAWGNRKSIIHNAQKLLGLMGGSPYEFIVNATPNDFIPFERFVHRTFNGTDTIYFLTALQHIYKSHCGLEAVFTEGYTKQDTLEGAFIHFRNLFFELPHPLRTKKHVSDVAKKASAKRLCMFMRWMVRNNKKGVDFGLWKNIPSAALMLPLDVHTGNVSRKLGLLTRKQNDWLAVQEVSAKLRAFEPLDPVKYDFALFGLGINENF